MARKGQGTDVSTGWRAVFGDEDFLHGLVQRTVHQVLEAETVLSQPATKVFFKTSEPHAAKWIAPDEMTLGDCQMAQPLPYSLFQCRCIRQSV